MVRNDEFFLKKWVEYYGSNLGRENIYVYFDGLDQTIPEFCTGVSCTKVEHKEGNVRQGDKSRIKFLSSRAKELFGSYDIVIGCDVDEFLVADPKLGISLKEFLSNHKSCLNSISGLGIDVGQNLNEEAPIDADRTFLSQRSYAKLSTRYSKTNTLLRYAEWGSGFHRVKGHNFHIVKDLYLFPFGCVDLCRIQAKMSDKGLVGEGWSRHLEKRAKTIRLVSEKKAGEWDRSVKIARTVQNIFRPPYALNKPAMFEAEIVVKIPERFQSII